MGVLDLMGYVQKQGELGRERGQQTRLGQLAGQSYTAAPDQQPGVLSEMARINPQAAQQQQTQFQGQDDRNKTKAAAAAQYVLNAQKTGDPNAVRGAYQTVRPFLEELGKATGKVPPPEWSDDMLPMLHQVVSAGGGAGASQVGVQSTYIDDQGQRIAILRDGTTQVLGRNAPNNQIIDTGNGFFGVNKGTLNAAPVNVGSGQVQGPQAGVYQTPQGIARIGDDLSPEQREAAMADMAGGGVATNVQLPPRDSATQQFGQGQQLRSAPKPAGVPPGYRDDGQGGLTPIPGGPAQVAIDARADAAAARKVAEELKSSAKRQEVEARQNASAEAANQLITSIDELTKHPGFGDLGTTWGDAKIGTPVIRSDAKDANAKLKNVAGQVALATMARLKTLSQSGATGFGSLTAPELNLLQNSIATLQSENISNAELKSSLKVIRDSMQKTADWKPPQDAQPQSDDDALIGKYLD
jgi:hypothetical protein